MQISSNPTVSRLWNLLSEDSQEFWIDSAISFVNDQLWIQCPTTEVLHLANPDMRRTPLTDLHEGAVHVGTTSILIDAKDCIIQSHFKSGARKWQIRTKAKNV